MNAYNAEELDALLVRIDAVIERESKHKLPKPDGLLGVLIDAAEALRVLRAGRLVRGDG